MKKRGMEFSTIGGWILAIIVLVILIGVILFLRTGSVSWLDFIKRLWG